MNILEKVSAYYEREYKSTAQCLENGFPYGSPYEVIMTSIKMCLGVAMFVQDLGVAYEDIDKLYMSYKKKFEDLLDKYSKL